MRRDVAWASSPHAPLPGTKENQNQRRKEGRGEGDRERETEREKASERNYDEVCHSEWLCDV
jgi:hypothetical protein